VPVTVRVSRLFMQIEGQETTWQC